MIIDACTFAGEWEMLAFRIRLLRDVVDHFIVVQGDRTFSGIKRDTLVPMDTVKRLGLDVLGERLVFHTAELTAPDPWAREYQQRDAIAPLCASFRDYDRVILSDVDEIPSLEAIEKIKKHPLTSPRVLAQYFFYYRMTNLRNELWHGSIVSTLARMRQIGAQGLRNARNVLARIALGGWHFSYFGDAERIQEKLHSFSHQEYNCPPFTDPSHIERCRISGEDLFGRGTRVRKVDPSFFPDYVVKEARSFGWL